MVEFSFLFFFFFCAYTLISRLFLSVYLSLLNLVYFICLAYIISLSFTVVVVVVVIVVIYIYLPCTMVWFIDLIVSH